MRYAVSSYAHNINRRGAAMTIKEIANSLGVSTATVSNVIHGHLEKMSPETAQLVRKKLEQYQYIPNMGARMLAKGDSEIVGVITNYPNREEKFALQDPFVSEMIAALENAIRARGYYTMLRAAQTAAEIHRISQTWNAVGLIVMGLQANQCRELVEATRKPIVFVDCYFDEGEQYNNVGLDDLGGMRQLTETLLKLGHRNMLLVGDQPTLWGVDALRLRGHQQALSAAGVITYGSAIPIIMGQNIGTCVTALLSSVGTTKNARRAAVVHLMFNIIGTAVCLTLFVLADALFSPAILGESASYLGIAICHTVFNVICTTLMLPAAGLLEKLVCRIVPDGKQPEAVCELDERLLATPSIALERCRVVTNEMADVAAVTLRSAAAALQNYTPELAQAVREGESKTDHYEDILGTYLVKLSALKISESDSSEAAMLLKALSDFERIGDHALNILESAEELKGKNLSLSDAARHELSVLLRAVEEIVDMTFQAFRDDDLEKAYRVEPLEQVIDDLKEKMRIHHILRMQQGSCSIESGFVWSDLLTALERVGDHCSNIAGCIIDLHHHNMNTHEAIRSARMENENFDDEYKAYAVKYSLK